MAKKGGLGRLFVPDARDKKYTIKKLMAAAPGSPPTTPGIRYWWEGGWWGDQGYTSQCVAYSWTHWLTDGPTTNSSYIRPTNLYNEAQKIDEWPGEDYDGTSVRAGAKVLTSKGFIGEYHWGWSLDDAIQVLLNKGPVVVGTNWYDSMFVADETRPFFIKIKPNAQIAGGHAYVLNGINVPEERVRVKNSWGRNWAHNGNAFLSFKDLERLIKEDGEVCLATEIKK